MRNALIKSINEIIGNRMKLSPRTRAVVIALFVVFLWATSWVLIKQGLGQIPPLIFAGLRYSLAFICLLPVLFFSPARQQLVDVTRKEWIQLGVLGLLFYTATQGASFVALSYLPAISVNLLWSFSSVAVALLGMVFLNEQPTRLQWGGILLALMGAWLYFYPADLPYTQVIGLAAAGVGILANALAAVLGRAVNRAARLHPLLVTVVSMGAGSLALLTVGLVFEPLPNLDGRSWAIITWLAIVNTAFAFTLWNYVLRNLTAVESSVINSTMLVWIPIFAVVFLGEKLVLKGVVGLAAVGVGALLVQMKRQS